MPGATTSPASEGPLITWVNHAGFLIEYGGVDLLIDPWIEGTAFNDGWALLSPSAFGYEDFSKVTHIWFSHEHSDHFSPPVLRRIPEEVRRKIVVLYQQTKDRKVAEFCRSLGFPVREMADGEAIELAEDVIVRCRPMPGGDSWLHVTAGAYELLNLNDCVINTPRKVERIKRLVPKVDVLFTQFSYANYVGNEDQIAKKRAAAVAQIERLKLQVNILDPRIVVPFASFVWFCQEENRHMNDQANRIDAVAEIVEHDLGRTCRVLYPGDHWRVGEPIDNGAAIERYLADYEAVKDRAALSHPAVPAGTIERAGRAFLERMRRENSRSAFALLHAVAYLKPAVIQVRDIDKAYRLDLRGRFEEVPGGAGTPDIVLSGHSLMNVFERPWGPNTLAVNGRFVSQSYPDDGFWRAMDLAAFNSRGEYVTVPWLIGKALRRIWRLFAE